jgi:hypothetical protein
MVEGMLRADGYVARITALHGGVVNDVKALLEWASLFWTRDHGGRRRRGQRKSEVAAAARAVAVAPGAAAGQIARLGSPV